MSKNGSDFAPPDEIEDFVVQAEEIHHATQWSEADRTECADKLSRWYVWLNTAHPFREGNGRATTAIMKQTLAQTSFTVDLARKIVKAAGQSWTHCDGITVDATRVSFNISHRGTHHTLTVDHSGTIVGVLSDLPAFRRAAVEMHLTAATPSVGLGE